MLDLNPLGPIQIIPPGLLGLLQLKQLGRLPAALDAMVHPVIEMRDWYFTSRRVGTIQQLGGTTPPLVNTLTQANLAANNGWFGFTGGGGGGLPAVVPGNQLWYVEEMTVWGKLTAAGSTLRFAPAVIGSSQGNSDNQIVGPDYNDLVTAAIRTVAARADRGFWMFPGDQFGVYLYSVTTATQETVNLDFRLTPLQV